MLLTPQNFRTTVLRNPDAVITIINHQQIETTRSTSAKKNVSIRFDFHFSSGAIFARALNRGFPTKVSPLRRRAKSAQITATIWPS